jgi:hypothetical protein
VEQHLTRIYRKLKVKGRADLPQVLGRTDIPHQRDAPEGAAGRDGGAVLGPDEAGGPGGPVVV